MDAYRMHLLRNDLQWLQELPWGNDPEGWARAGGIVMKKSASRFAFIWPGETPVFIKRYLSRRVGARWLSWVRGTKSTREARILIKLRGKGIAAPEPLAVVTPAISFGRRTNYLVEELLTGNDVFNAAQSSPEGAGTFLVSIAEDLGILLARMHSIGFFHPDTSLHNFLLHEPSKTLHTIDVDGGRFFPGLLTYHRRKNLGQILRSGAHLTDEKKWIDRLYEAYTSCSGVPLEAIALL